MPPAVGGSREVAIKLVSRHLLCDDVVERGDLKSTGSAHLGDYDAVVCVQPRRAAYRHFLQHAPRLGGPPQPDGGLSKSIHGHRAARIVKSGTYINFASIAIGPRAGLWRFIRRIMTLYKGSVSVSSVSK